MRTGDKEEDARALDTKSRDEGEDQFLLDPRGPHLEAGGSHCPG